MLDVRLKMLENDRLRRSCAPSTSSINNLTSHIPHSALTLIELLVVIVILTTLVGGVIPLLSPNNDERKIQVASRGLQGYIVQAQAQAARTGRPQGIAFRESSAGSGVALEVFGLEVPPPFAGFSTESRCTVTTIDLSTLSYGTGRPPSRPPASPGNGGVNFPLYNGEPLYELRFVITTIGGTTNDPFPPRSFRIGDTVNVGGNEFLIVDDNNRLTYPNLEVKYGEINGDANTGVWYLEPDLVAIRPIIAVWLNNSGQVAPQGFKRYQINRQPTNSSESPYQMPAGIVIDMQASVTEGNGNAVTRFPTAQSLYSNRTIPPIPATIPTDFVGIMFSPTGAVDRVIFNGNELTSVSRIVLMLGRIENGALDPTIDLTNSGNAPWTVQLGEKVEDVQERINWLNLDSRLLSIIANNGRAIVSEPAFVDPTLPSNIGADDGETAELQLETAHSFAHEMTTAK